MVDVLNLPPFSDPSAPLNMRVSQLPVLAGQWVGLVCNSYYVGGGLGWCAVATAWAVCKLLKAMSSVV